ncbi:MAG: fumarate hydratase, partial [Candidatus Bathyarchaeota archaeon]
MTKHSDREALLSDIITDVSAKIYYKALITIPKDVHEEVKRAFKRETNELAREQLDQILKNIEAAQKDNNLICQDVGIPTFFVDIGTEFGCKIDIRQAISNGMKKLYREEPHILTYQLNPIGWKRGASWEGIHTPFVYIDLIANADYIQLTAFPKGTGSSMWGK